jgi:hypothetical protein
VLHPMLIGRSDIKDLHPIRRSFRDGLDHLLHLSICRVVIAHIKPQDTLRLRHISSIFTACIEIEFRFGLGKTKSSEGQANEHRRQDGFDLHRKFKASELRTEEIRRIVANGSRDRESALLARRED